MFEHLEGARITALQAGIIEASAVGAEIIAQAAPVDQGILKNSISHTISAQGAEIVIDAPHASAVELGSRPHWAPIGPLIRWAERHGAENPYAMAKGIQKKIAAHGTKPTWFVKNSIPKLERALGTLVKRALDNAR